MGQDNNGKAEEIIFKGLDLIEHHNEQRRLRIKYVCPDGMPLTKWNMVVQLLQH